MITEARPNAKPILVAGLGNLLLQDDGVGVHVVEELRKSPPEGVVLAEIGTAILRALHLFEESDPVIVIDAMRGGNPPGTIYRLDARDIDREGAAASLHQLGLLGALRFLETPAPPEIHVIGVEPQQIDYNMELSDPVKAALPRVCQETRTLIQQLQSRRIES